MSNDKHRGQHLGYLEYHAQVLQDRLEELNRELHTIQENNSGKKKKIKERSALLEFRKDVKMRAEKIQYQTDGVKEHESDKAVSVASRQMDSAYRTHQQDNNDVDEDATFTKASDIGGDS